MIPPKRLVISEIMSGAQTYEEPFFINNDSFPILTNALCWRKRVMKKPGARRLGRLQRQIGTTDGMNGQMVTATTATPIQSGISQFQIGTTILVDTGGGMLANNGTGPVTGSLNLNTGQLTLTNNPTAALPIYYFPTLPVMGIEEFESDKSPNTQIDFPTNVFFDQTYSYQFNGTNFYDVSFYKMTGDPVTWHGQNFQQFYSCNYYRALWVTNNTPGFHFLNATYVSGSGTPTITFTFMGAPSSPLKVGDWLWFNEWTDPMLTINGKSGQVTQATLPIQVTFTENITVSGTGIAQLMTNSLPGGGDGIRWYDGFTPTALGWVNFAPPLDSSAKPNYLMGARMIIPFGNRLLAIGTFEGSSSTIPSSATYYGNRIRYCEVNATPFYAAPVPDKNPDDGFDPQAWVSDIQGFGGFIDLDTTERIISAAVTQGSLILGLESEQRRLNNTGIETQPYILQTINPDYGTAGTFSVIPMDKGILTVGEYGLLATSSYDAKRFDEKIIDQIFQIDQSNNGFERICAVRDFDKEVVYFTYYSDSANENNTFPDTTIVYNYREGSFAIWYETFTTYGIYKNSTMDTWATYYTPWENWTEKWEDLGADRESKPLVAGGTPQGYVMIKWDVSSFNQGSLTITGVSNIVGVTSATIVSPNHNLNNGMYVGFWETVPSTSEDLPLFNGSVIVVDENTINVTFGDNAMPANIIPGVWEMSVVDLMDIWTKQFQLAWSANFKTRIGAQKYFLDKTTGGQFTVNLYGSQSPVPLNCYIPPDDPPIYLSAISSNIVRTYPDESLGLNDNAISQSQIWHRLASSVIGDTVQLEFTLSATQMLDINFSTAPWVLYSTVLDLYPSRILA